MGKVILEATAGKEIFPDGLGGQNFVKSTLIAGAGRAMPQKNALPGIAPPPDCNDSPYKPFYDIENSQLFNRTPVNKDSM